MRPKDTSLAGEIIVKLGLVSHPEGGWFAETWRGRPGANNRATGTAIHFLLETGQHSHWHTVDAAEIWLWHDGDPLLLSTAASDGGPVRQITLGPEVLAGQSVQHVIEPGEWQAASLMKGPAGYALVSCVVTPGFEFSGFRLATEGWEPGARE